MKSSSAAFLAVPVGPRDRVVGPPDAPVTLVEYGDYECPHCGAAHPIVHELLDRLGDEVRFAYRHFPLASLHPHAQSAAEAAEAAGAQGRFWDMHDMLFQHQHALTLDDLLLYGAALQIDVDRLGRELTGRVHAPRIREDFMGGVQSGVNGTPTFFINGARYDGLYDLASLLGAVEEEIASLAGPLSERP